MHADSLDAERAALHDRLCQLSTEAWAAEVDRLARFESVTVDEALTLLARRFGVDRVGDSVGKAPDRATAQSMRA